MRWAPTFRSRLTAPPVVAAVVASICPFTLADEPLVTVRTVTDDSISGRLVEFSLERGLVLYTEDGDGPRHFPAEDVVHIVTDRHPVGPDPESIRLELAGGDLLFGRVTGFEADVLGFESSTIGPVRVPLARIAAWRTPVADDPRFRSAVAQLTDRNEDAADALLLTNGDVMRGLVAAIDEAGFLLETDSAGRSRVDHHAIVAVAMVPIDTADDRVDPADGPHVRVLATDGQRLTASALRWSDVSVTATVFDRSGQRIPTDRIARLDVIGGRWEWLTSLQPISYEHTPALALDWDWQIDRNVAGGPLRVAGRTFEHGLGVHSQCSITFDLREAFTEFVTSMGVDDQAGPYADVDVEIRVDGQLRFTRQSLRPGTLHGPVRLDVTGARRIKLTVLFGRNADVQDRFDWIEAALIR